MILSSAVAGAISGLIGGSAVPIVGNIVGFVVGLVVGIGTALVDYYLPQIRQGIKDFTYGIIMEAKNFFARIGNFFSNTFGW